MEDGKTFICFYYFCLLRKIQIIIIGMPKIPFLHHRQIRSNIDLIDALLSFGSINA